MLRLSVFLFAILGIYFLHTDTKFVLAIGLLTIILFLYLVSRHTDLQYKRDKFKALIKINEAEIVILNRKFYDQPSGEKYKDASHYFSQDIDLFGKGSFYQYLNRTALPEGSDALADFLKENTIEGIPEKQLGIAELSGNRCYCSLVKDVCVFCAQIYELSAMGVFCPFLSIIFAVFFGFDTGVRFNILDSVWLANYRLIWQKNNETWFKYK